MEALNVKGDTENCNVATWVVTY